MNQWKALNGRITLLPAAFTSSPLASALELYRRVWGVDPDSFQKLPNALAPTLAQGKLGDMMATCSAHPTRIDLNLVPAPDNEVPMSIALIEDTSQLRSKLLEIVDAINRGSIEGSIARVALGLHFLVPKESCAEANKTLISVIPDRYGVRITDEEDFIFQINQPYPSRKAKDYRMNAVTKWSVDRLQVLTFSVQAGSAGAPQVASSAPVMPQTKTFMAASVSFDFSNVPTEHPLSPASQSSLLGEALAGVAQKQQEVGLHVEGFENV